MSLLLLAEIAVTLAIPWVGGRFAEKVLATADTPHYQPLLAVWLALLIAQNALRFANSYLLGSAGAAATTRLRCRIYDHLQALPLSYHQEHDPGSTLTLLTRDAGILGQFFTSTLPNLAPQLLTILGAWLLMASLDLTLALMIGLAVPTITLAVRLFLRHIRPIARELAKAHGSHMATVEENLRLVTLLKAFGREELESVRIQEHDAGILVLEKRHLLSSSLIAPAVQSIGAVLLILLLWVSADRLLDAELAIGQVVSLLLYGLLLFRPAGLLASAAGSFQSTRGASERLLAVFSSPIEPIDQGESTVPAAPGEIEFRDVSYGYPGQSRLLEHFNLNIHAGETVALTGPNGSGKSTLVQLLMRFRIPDEGEILLGGKPIQDLKLGTLRSLIGLVPQHTTLINDTLRANIAFGVPDASEQDIYHAAKLAQANHLIESLPAGLDSLIGPDGVRLSGGQKQRVALARALLRNCPILILDEATSMFDLDAERAFVSECRRNLANRTVILITHRPASLKLADRVIDMDGFQPKLAN